MSNESWRSRRPTGLRSFDHPEGIDPPGARRDDPGVDVSPDVALQCATWYGRLRLPARCCCRSHPSRCRRGRSPWWRFANRPWSRPRWRRSTTERLSRKFYRRPARLRQPRGVTAALAWWMALAAVYAAGVLVMLARFGLDRRNLKRLAREAIEVRDREWTGLLERVCGRLRVRRPVRLLRSRERSMPMAFGTRQPPIVVPPLRTPGRTTGGAPWCFTRWRTSRATTALRNTRLCRVCAVLVPPGGMVGCATLARGAGAGVRRSRHRGRPAAREYADHLLEIAYAFGGDRAPALAVSMARPRQLEGRMLAALDAARNRSVPDWPVRLAGAVVAAALLLPVATATSAVVTADPEEVVDGGMDLRPSGDHHNPHSGASARAAGSAFAAPARDIASGAQAAPQRTADTQAAQDGGTWESAPPAPRNGAPAADRARLLLRIQCADQPADGIDDLTTLRRGRAGSVPSATRCGHLHVRRRAAQRDGCRHVLVHGGPAVPRGAGQTGLRPADDARAISDGATRCRLRLR